MVHMCWISVGFPATMRMVWNAVSLTFVVHLFHRLGETLHSVQSVKTHTFHRLCALARKVADCLGCCPAARLFVQLVDLFQFYMMFPIDDHTGDPVSDEDVTAAHYEKVQQVGSTVSGCNGSLATSTSLAVSLFHSVSCTSERV